MVLDPFDSRISASGVSWNCSAATFDMKMYPATFLLHYSAEAGLHGKPFVP
jgi:hypothetical protein